MSKHRITLRQLMAVVADQIAWLRIYPDAQTIEQVNYMSKAEMQRALETYGEKAVLRVLPGYYFVIVYLDK